MSLKKTIAVAALGLPPLGVLAHKGAFASLFGMNYLPHRYCYLAQPWLIWSNVTMDALIAASYVVIFSCLFWIAGRLRRFPEIHAFLWVFIAFGIFIVACASTHLMEVVTIWWPLYRLSVAFKVLCAASSVATAILFAKAAPELTRGIHQFLNMFSTTQQAYASGVEEREQVQGQFRSSQAQLQAILDSVLDSIIMIDAAGTIVSTNAAVVKMFAYEAEELVGKNVKMLMPEPNRSNHDGHLARYQSTGMTKAIGVGRELEGLTRSGKVFPMELTITELSLLGQRMFVGLIRDISDRKLSEGMRERFAAVVDSSNDAIISKTLEGIITAWNRGAEKIFGYTASEVVGQPMLLLIPPDRIGEESEILACIRRGQSVEHFETVRVCKDGTRIDVSVTISPIRDSNGVIAGASKIARDISERKRGEEALREKEHLLSESQRIAYVGSWTYDLFDPGGLLTWSEQMYKIHGVSPESFAPTVESFIGLMLPEDQPRMQEWIAACVAGEKPGDCEFRVLLSNGRVRSLSGRAELQRDSQNKPIRLVGTVQDITERRQAEDALWESKEQFQAMANGMPQLASIADADGSIVWYNQRWYEFTGTTFEQMQGWGWHTVPDPDFLPIVIERWKQAIAAGAPFEMEFPLRGADGLFRAFLTRVVPLKNSAGQVVRWFGTNTDISERKQAEEQLALQAEQLSQSRQALEEQSFMLRSVLDSMVEGLVAADEQGKFIIWNPAAKKLLGLGAADLPPNQWSAHYGVYFPDKVTLIPPGQTPLERAILGEVVQGEIFLRNPQLEREVWLEINSSPLRGKDGVLRGGVAAFRDISQRKADEHEIRALNNNLEDRIAKRTEQLEAANRELEAFSYSVSHDLRTPLRHISAFARILVNDFGAEMTGEAREHLQRIEDAVLRMGLLVDALLNMAVLRRRPLRLSPTELNRLIAEVISVLAPECEGREVEWRIGRLPSLECDPVLMSQVFQNLLSNALKYSSGRCPAVIEVDTIEEPGKPVIVLVRDNGAGFDMRYSRKLFGMFQRLHTESEFAGTGVGLATVHRIIQKHGGLIWAEAEPDHGATFYFSLQVAEPAEVTAKAMAFPLTWPNGLA
jgi:PAS domain S-box-containing protein